jgi:hypothetical protein
MAFVVNFDEGIYKNRLFMLSRVGSRETGWPLDPSFVSRQIYFSLDVILSNRD